MRLLARPPALSVEVLLLESPEAFAQALLSHPPHADENYLIARHDGETLRSFGVRALRRVRRMLASPDQIASVSYLFSGHTLEGLVRRRLLKALLSVQPRCGSFRLIGPRSSSDSPFGYLDELRPGPLRGHLQATRLPTGWTVMST